MRCATLEQDFGLDVCEAASCVEHPPDGVAVQQQQRIGGKPLDVYETRMAEFAIGLGNGSARVALGQPVQRLGLLMFGELCLRPM